MERLSQMNAPTDFDIGPLTWVKSEIDLALERSDKALQQFTESAVDGNGDLTQIRFCRTHLHQVQGALTIVGLDGVTHFAEALELLLESIEQQQSPAKPASIVLAQDALAALHHYLDDLIRGQPNQPLRLLPLYRRVQAARGLERVPPTDLFFPDLSILPPNHGEPVPKRTREELAHRLRQQRARFQRGLLAWLRAPGDGVGASEMLGAVKRIEAVQEIPSARAFWWVATAFLAALGEGTLPPDAEARQLCSRIDLQARRLLEGSSNVAERLMRDALYLVGSANSRDSRVLQVQETYHLATLIPDAAGAHGAPAVAVESVRRRLRETIAATEEAWNRFCSGMAQALPVFRANTAALSTLVEELGHADFRRLVRAITDVAELLVQSPARHNDALAMETATAILLAQNAQENIQYLDQSFSHQVDVMVDRIRACIAGELPQPGSELPSLDEMSREAQEKLLVGQVAREIKSNLAQIEQVLDGFFREVERRGELSSLEIPVRQVVGALTMMRHDGAVAVLRQCAKKIEAFSLPEYVPQDGDFEAVAEQLSLLGFFVDAIPQGATDFENFVRSMRASTAPAHADETAAATVEQELEQQKRDTHALLVALKEQPEHAGLRQEVQQNLTSLQKDADLVADKTLGQQTKHVLSALASGGDAVEQIDAAMATLKLQVPEAPPPSAETIQLSQASAEEVDAELLEIFLQEADEVLASVQANLLLLHEQPHDVALLTALRRSAHTLKGSGRMVGLRDLGEAAWSVEQVLNLWLRQEQVVTPELFDLLEQAYGVFFAWVEHLKSGQGELPDATRMVALANALRDGSEAAQPLPLIIEAKAVPAVEIAEAPELPEETELASPSAKAPATGLTPPTRLSLAPALAAIFHGEAGTHLATLQREFSSLEADHAAPTTHEIYRAAHTLAGISGTVGIPAVQALAHALECALQRRDHGARREDADALATVGATIAALARMLAEVAREDEPEAAPELCEALDKLYPKAAAEPPPAPPSAGPQKGTAREVGTPAPSPAVAAPEISQLQDELDEQLLPLFIEEALDLNQSIAAQLHSWRNDPADGEAPRRLARLFHSLKGSARMAGAMNLGELTHAIETRMQQAQDAGSAPLQLIDDIDNAFDVIVQIVEGLQRGEAAESTIEIADAAATEIASAGTPQPAPGIPSTQAEAPEPETEAAAQRAMLRVRADLIDRLVNEAGELSIARSRIEGEMRAIKESLLDLTENVIRLRRQLRDIELQAELQMQSRAGQSAEQHVDFDPLEFDRFTRFQELTRMMAESVNDVATVQQNLLKNLDDANAAIVAQARLNREVQQELMSVRMVPFGSVVDRLYRIVRQAAKEVGKRANLEIRGAQLELDRTVLDKMLAPLEHMLRNAVAHGLEDTSTRLAKGKPEIGEISLKLAQEGNEIIVSLADDGAGLDLERLRERGLEAGLLTADAAIDPTRVVDLIFAPGISTAAEVSQLSGRGIGMDVLKSEVTSLGGRIEVLSSPDQGTTFRLYLPLTLAVTKALLVRSGKRHYAIPSVMIAQVLDLKEPALADIRAAREAVWAGNPYPFGYLPHLLGETQALPEKRSRYWVLLLRSGSKRIALQVDELLGNQEIVVKNIGPQLARVIGIDGATVLGNGQVVLILNPIALASRDRMAAAVSPVPTVREPQVSDSVTGAVPTIMIVDDSLTVRKVTSRLLAREGYQVMAAKDGVDALEQLVALVPDVLLVDIEMPRMDGFEFTRNVRADKRLQSIPIIMITSRTADKHRQYAFELGVNHYLGKPYQEDELLGLVAGHVKEQRQT